MLSLSQEQNALANGPGTPPFSSWRLWQFYKGRRLSEVFEPRHGQDPAAHALGRLIAEFPKPSAECCAEHIGLIVVDLPDRVRIFEDGAPAQTEATATTGVPACHCAGCQCPECLCPECSSGGCQCSDCQVSNGSHSTCTGSCCQQPNCQEQFRAFLEDFLKTSGAEEVVQTGHTQADSGDIQQPREFPNVAPSKIETTVVTYPLGDLVLLDDAGRPVFDTCTIIEHIETSVAPETWSHPSVSIQLDQKSVSLVIRQTREVHEKIEEHLRYLRRLQVKQICNLIERMSTDLKAPEQPVAVPSPEAIEEVPF